MQEPLPTGQLQKAAARLVGQTLQLTDDVTELAQLVEVTGIELSAATRHEIELELRDAALGGAPARAVAAGAAPQLRRTSTSHPVTRKISD